MTGSRDSFPKGDAAIWRTVVEQMTEDRRRISVLAAAMRGTSIVTRWQSAEQRERAAIAKAEAKRLSQTSARLRRVAGTLHRQPHLF
jgi:hypothetical protein